MSGETPNTLIDLIRFSICKAPLNSFKGKIEFYFRDQIKDFLANRFQIAIANYPDQTTMLKDLFDDIVTGD